MPQNPPIPTLPERDRVAIGSGEAGGRSHGLWARGALFTLGYLGCAWLSRALTENPDLESSYWLPSGLFLGALLVTRRAEWWAMSLGLVLGDALFNEFGAAWPWGIWLLVTVGNLSSGLLGAWLMQRFVVREPAMRSIRELTGLILVSAGISLLVTATIGAYMIKWVAPEAILGEIWLSWYCSDLLGVILLTPLILAWRQVGRPRWPLAWTRRHLEVTAMLAGAGLYLFGVLRLGWLDHPASRYAPLLYVLWAALRFGLRGVTVVSLAVALGAGWFALRGRGIDAHPAATAHLRNVRLQLDLAFFTIFGLVPAIVVAAHRRIETELRGQRNFLSAMFDSATECIQVVGLDGELLLINQAGLRVLEAANLAEARAFGLMNFIHQDSRGRFRELLAQARQGISGTQLLRVRGRRGLLRWWEVQVSPLLDGDRVVDRLLLVARDVTDANAVQEALQLARFTVDNAMLAMFWVDREARIVETNAAASRLLGYTRAEMAGLRVPDIDPEFSPERWPRHWAQLHGAGSLTFESRQRRKDGSEIRVIVSTHYLRVGERELSCAFVQDITEQVAAAERIQSLNQRLQLAVRGAGYGVWEIQLNTGTVIWDERMFAIYGCAAADFGGSLEAWTNLLHADSRASFDEFLRDLVTGEAAEQFDFRIIRGSDRATREIEANAYLQVDSELRPQRVVGMNRDVTVQRHAEQAHRKSEEQLRLIFSAVAEGVIVHARNLSIVQCNAAAERILGLSVDRILGRIVLSEHFQAIREDGQPYPVETQPAAVALATGRSLRDHVMGLRRPGGEVTWISINAEPLRDAHGEVSMVVVSFSDITGSRALQEQLRQAQKMEVVGQLAGGIAHDFNNILTAMMLNLELMESTPRLPEGIRQPITDMTKMTRRAAKLTEQLLLFARRRVMQTEPIDLSAGVGLVLKMIRRILGEQIAVHLVVSPESLWVNADPGMLDQVVMNLCVNARDAMPGGGRLTIETGRVNFGSGVEPRAGHPLARAGSFARLRVSDTGSGMSPEVRAHLFEPFFTTKGVGKGTGLGLATVHGIIQQHRGWVEVESAEGQGSAFMVYLPLAEPTPGAAAGLVPRPERIGGPEKILLVEDEPVVRAVTATMLRQLGYQVLEAGNGPEALAVWQRHGGSVDLLITDMVMPQGMTGLQLGEAIRRAQPSMRIIIISGYVDQELTVEFLQAAGITLIAKPFEFGDLAAAVRRKLVGENAARG